VLFPARAQLLPDTEDFLMQLAPGGIVRNGSGSNNHVHARKVMQYILPYGFTQAPFQAIPLHTPVTEFRHNEPHAWMTQKGSDPPDFEVRCPDALPAA
jgi:hypothetical protein